MQFYDRLQQETQSERNFLLTSPVIEDVMQGEFSLQTYIAFLDQAYHHVKHTVPLLMLAGARLQPQQQWMQSALSEYIMEESGHELWILNDLEACGAARERDVAPFDSEIMVAYLYDTIQRINPAGVFGMVQVLEGTSVSLATTVAGIVQSKLGLPDAAMSYLTSHGTLDQEHLQHLKRILDQIDDTQDQNAIIHVACNVYRLYGNVFRAIPDEATRLQDRAAA